LLYANDAQTKQMLDFQVNVFPVYSKCSAVLNSVCWHL